MRWVSWRSAGEGSTARFRRSPAGSARRRRGCRRSRCPAHIPHEACVAQRLSRTPGPGRAGQTARQRVGSVGAVEPPIRIALARQRSPSAPGAAAAEGETLTGSSPSGERRRRRARSAICRQRLARGLAPGSGQGGPARFAGRAVGLALGELAAPRAHAPRPVRPARGPRRGPPGVPARLPCAARIAPSSPIGLCGLSGIQWPVPIQSVISWLMSRGRPAVPGGPGEHSRPRRSGAISPGPRRALLVDDPLVCQGEGLFVGAVRRAAALLPAACRRLWVVRTDLGEVLRFK